MSQLTPSRELGELFGNMIHREQSFGEIRGLQRLQILITDRKFELEAKLGMNSKSKPLNIDGYDTD